MTEVAASEQDSEPASGRGMRLRSPLFVLYVAISVGAIFFLPLAIPMRPSGSISYVLGFNNRAALIALLLSLLVGCFAMRDLRWEPPVGDAREIGGPSRAAIRNALLVVLLLCAGLVVLNISTWGMDESPYLIGRVRQLLAGRTPYVDFEFIYGPALIYLPAWTARLLRIDAGPAYFVVWVAEWLLSVGVVALLVRWLGFARDRADAAFYVLGSLFVSSLLTTGETYAPVRQASVLLCMLGAHVVLSRRPVLVFPAAVAAAAVLFLLSPEMALAFMAAVALYLVLWAAVDRERIAIARPMFAAGLVAMLLVFGAEYVLAARAHMFDSAREFGSGGADVPLLLAPVTVFVLSMVFVAGVFVARRLRARQVRDPRVAAACAAAVLLPGAMGRSDPGHVILYSVSGLAVALVLLSAQTQRMWRVGVGLTLLLCTAPMIVFKLNSNHLQVYDSAVKLMFPTGRVESSGVGHAVDAFVSQHLGESAEHKLWRRLRREPADPHAAYPMASRVLAAPFGYAVPGMSGSTVRDDVALGYLDGMNDVMSAGQIQRKIGELRAHPERDLLVPGGMRGEESCATTAEYATGLLRAQYGFNYLRKQRNVSHTFGPLCRYVSESYVPVASPRDEMSLYELWRRRADLR